MAYSKIKKCKWCGVEYHKDSGEGDFCSLKCKHDHSESKPKSPSFSWFKLAALIVIGGYVYAQYLSSNDSSPINESSNDLLSNRAIDVHTDEELPDGAEDEMEESEEVILHNDRVNDVETSLEGQYVEEDKPDEEVRLNSRLDISYNEVFNQELYLLRQIWYYFGSNGCQTLTIYSEDTPLEILIYKNGRQVNREENYDKFMRAYADLESSITVVRIDDQVFKITDNDLGFDLNPKVYDLAKEQVEHCRENKRTGHEQNNLTYEDRLIKHGVSGAGVMGENVSKVVKQPNSISTLRRTSIAFYNGRYTSGHWDAWMSNYKYFTTVQVTDNVYSYTVTIMSEALSNR